MTPALIAIGTWLAGVVIGYFIVTAKATCEAWSEFPERLERLYSTQDGTYDFNKSNRERHIANRWFLDKSGFGLEPGLGLFILIFWPVLGPIWVVVYGVIFLCTWTGRVAQASGKACAEAKTCKLKGNQ